MSSRVTTTPAARLAASLALVGALALATAGQAHAQPWQDVRAISTPGEAAEGLQVATARNGRAVAAWTTSRGGEHVLQAALRDPSGDWSSPSDLGTVPFGPSGLAINAAGDAVVVWQSPAGPMVAVRPRSSVTWRPSVPIAVPGGAAAVAIEDSGAIVVLTSRSLERDAFAVEGDVRSAVFGPARRLSAPGDQIGIRPRLAMRPDGAAVAWWTSGYAVRPSGGPFGGRQPLPDARVRSDVRVTLGLAPDGSVVALRTGLDGLEATSGPSDAPLPPYERRANGIFGSSIAFDRTGGALVLTRDPGPTRGMPVAVVGERSPDGAWTPFRQISPAERRVVDPFLSANAAGGAVASWTLRRPLKERIAQMAVRPATGERFAAPEQLPAALGSSARAAIEDDGDLFAWALDEGTVRVANRPRDAARPVVSAEQLRINQRISQAAIRRLNALEAMIAGVPAPKVTDGLRPASVQLTKRRLQINQRIAQAAVYRANLFTAMLDGELEPVERPRREPSARVELDARQFQINQRISQAAVRRVNALAARLPDLPVPRPPILSAPVRITDATALGAYRVRVNTVERGPIATGAELAIVLPPHLRDRPPTRGRTVAADGMVVNGVIYPFAVSVYDLEG